MLSKEERQQMISLMQHEVVPAIGCTEPVAVALCAARAAEKLGALPERVEVELSMNVLKNAMGVGIPGTGMIGLPIAIALGMMVGKSSYKLEVLKEVTPEAVERGRRYIDEGRIGISLKEDAPDGLYIKVLAISGEESATAIICGEHTRFVEEGMDCAASEAEGVGTTEDAGMCVPLTLRRIYDFITEVPIEEIAFIEESAKMNMTAAELSFKADYGWEGTGALPDAVAMYENYGYSPLCHYLMRDKFSLESWNNMMRNEIERGRPVYYSGYTASEEGHAFVLDGVDANDYFHVNWGWGGASDGFFKLDALVLDDYVFDTNEWAYLGLYPLRDGVFDNWLYLYDEGLELTTEEFVRGEQFTIDNITIANPSVVDFEGEMCVGHCDIDGNFKSWVTSAVPFSLISGYAYITGELSALIEGEICAGDRLRVFYRVSGSEAWSPMMPYLEGVCWEVVLKHPSIGDTTSFEFDRNRGVVELRFESDVVATLRLLNDEITSGVECSEGVMIIDTSYLRHDTAYTIYLERSNGESKSIMFTLNETVL